MEQHTYIVATRSAQTPSMQYFFDLAQGLVEKGQRVIILVSDQRHDIEDHLANPAIYTWPSKNPTGWRDAIYFYHLVRKHHPDVLIANFNSVNIFLVEGWLLGVRVRLAWYRTILSANLMNLSNHKLKASFQRLRRKLVYCFATKIIANSEAAREDLVREYGVHKRRTHVIHNSMSAPDISCNGISKDKNLLVCVSRFMPSKGQDVLVQAVAYLKEKNPRLRVEFIGKVHREDKFASKVQDLALKLEVAANCFFIGAIPHNEVLEHMARAWITIFPTRSEAFGLVNIESMSVGTPVIASRVGGIPEVIRDGVDGILVPPDDPKAIAEAVQRLLADDDLHKQMSNSCHQRFLEVFDRRKVIAVQADWFINLASGEKK